MEKETLKLHKVHASQDKINTGSRVISDYIKSLVSSELSKLTSVIQEDVKNMNGAIDIYSKIVLNVEKEQRELSAKIEGSINTIKFLFGGGCILTLINIVVMIFISTLQK